MKSNLWSRIRAAGCCAAFSLVLFLGGCTSAASSTSTAPSSSSQALSEAPTSQVVPSGEDDTAPAPSIDATENGFNGLTDPTEAFSRGLGWGPGTAGTSLKQAAAAAAMMDWAEENGAADRSAGSLNDCLSGWFNSLDTFDQENFAEAWPLIEASAQRILEDPRGRSPRSGRRRRGGDPHLLERGLGRICRRDEGRGPRAAAVKPAADKPKRTYGKGRSPTQGPRPFSV